MHADTYLAFRCCDPACYHCADSGGIPYAITFRRIKQETYTLLKYRTSMDPPPPLKKNLYGQIVQPPPQKISILQFCTATAPPSLEFPDGCNWCRGAGAGGAGTGTGAGRAGDGGQGVLGRLPDHSSLALLNNFSFRYRLTAAPFRNQYTFNHRPVTAPTNNII